MARRTKRQEKPAKSNRGRPDARGVFVIFEQDVEEEETSVEASPVEDEPLARGHGDDAA